MTARGKYNKEGCMVKTPERTVGGPLNVSVADEFRRPVGAF